MKGISRWTEDGGSYRTVQRFFATDLPWLNLLVKFVQTHLFEASHEHILAGDATTITKSGSMTHGIGRFFSGVLGCVVKSLEFFVFSLVDVTKRTAYPLCVKQTVRSKAEKATQKPRKKARKSKKKEPLKKLKGRPKGVLNKNKNELNLSAELPVNQRVTVKVSSSITSLCESQISGTRWTFWTQSSRFDGKRK